jgi:very-short-patch-repair endonuclease
VSADDELDHLFQKQHTVAAWEQARELGFSRSALRHRVDRGSLERVSRRVLGLPGAVRSPERALMAAVLDAGPGAVVGRLSAPALWALPGFSCRRPQITRLRGSIQRDEPLGELFPVRYLPSHLVTRVRGIPVVSLPYLVFQLAGILHPMRTERIFEMVVTRSPGALITMHSLLPELAARGRDGIVVMRELLEQNPPGTRVVASGLEKRFQQILLDANEKPLRRQVDLGGHEWEGRVDFFDDEIAVLFEVDSDTYHLGALAQADDADRDARMRAAGFNEVVRIPEHWIWYESQRAVAAVREARRRWRRRISGSGSA